MDWAEEDWQAVRCARSLSMPILSQRLEKSSPFSTANPGRATLSEYDHDGESRPGAKYPVLEPLEPNPKPFCQRSYNTSPKNKDSEHENHAL